MIRLTIYTLRGIAIVSLIYYVFIIAVSGIHTSFLHFWIFLAFACTTFSLLLSHFNKINTAFTKYVNFSLCGIFWSFMILFIFIEGVLIYKGNNAPEPDAEYAIVLGAQVRGTVPSKTLYMRIKAAYAYLSNNPNTKVICSGGKGTGENVSEAYAIKQELVSMGIEESRIILEDKSTNTVENLRNSLQIIRDNKKSVVIITSNFHCYRAVRLAKKIGYQNVSTYNANEFMVTTLQYYVREFFALSKDFLFGNL